MAEAAIRQGVGMRRRWMVRLFLAVDAALLAGWLRYCSTAPRFVLPAPALPQPNAAEYYQRAAQQVEAVPGRERLCDPATPLDTLARLVAACGPAIETMREGMAYPYSTPPELARDGVEQSEIPAFVLGCLETARIRLAEARGDWQTVTAIAMELLRLGTDVPRGGYLAHAAWAGQLERMGLAELAAVGARLNAQQCREAAARLAELEVRRTPFAETLRAEHARFRAFLTRLSEGDSEAVRAVRRAWFGNYDLWGMYGPRGMWNLRGTAREVDQLYAQAIAEADLPRGARHPRRAPRYWLTRALGPTFPGPVVPEATLARWRLLRVELALRAYRLEHGEPAPSLQALVPRYLSEVPQDPFGAGEPLRYCPGPQAKAYSVGPDQTDDGGQILSWNVMNHRSGGDRAVRLGQKPSRHQCRVHLRIARQQDPLPPPPVDPQSERPGGPGDLVRW
ncbi:MAG: hypothetical protein QHJ73_12845 [Armatimonadota bacterium]|nr:hypothetical protein [Armatimonadota bacterium]